MEVEVGVEIEVEVGVEVEVKEGGNGSRGRRRGGGRLGFFWVFLFFPFLPKTRRGSGGALGDEVTRVQVVTGHTRETGLLMNWIKSQNRDSGLVSNGSDDNVTCNYVRIAGVK